MTPNKIDHLVNHVAFVFDRSVSMRNHADAVTQLGDQLTAHMARPQPGEQETHVTFYSFGTDIDLMFWEMDALRAQRHSLKGLYQIRGDTALIDATMRAISDLKLIPQFGGDHAFLIYIVTDGQENVSRAHTTADLARTLGGLPDNWTVAALVPNVLGVRDAKSFGFPQGNIAIWDTLSATGVEEAGATIVESFDNFTAMRFTGAADSRGTKQLFAPKQQFAPTTAKINHAAIAALGMIPVKPSRYDLLTVAHKEEEKLRIIDFFAANRLPWSLGNNFYELVRDEYISPDKELALVETGKGAQIVYIDRKIRGLLELPDDKKVLVAPGLVPGFGIFVQSKNAGRFMRPGRLLIRKV